MNKFEEVFLRVVAIWYVTDVCNFGIGLPKSLAAAGVDPKDGYVLVMFFNPISRGDGYLGLPTLPY